VAKKKTSKKAPARANASGKAAGSAKSARTGKSSKAGATAKGASTKVAAGGSGRQKKKTTTAAKAKVTTRSKAVASARSGAATGKSSVKAASKPVKSSKVTTKSSAKSAGPAKPTRKPASSAGAAATSKSPTRGVAPRPAATRSNSNGHSRFVPPPPPAGTHEMVLNGPRPEEELRKVKTGLTKRDMDYFRELLLEKRAEIIGSVEGMQEARNSGAGDSSHMPLHMADVGSEHFEQEFNLGLMESEKRLLREIDDALLRMQRGVYGVCLETARPIPRERLEIKPWAKYTIEVVMERERRGLR
jgi:DnaK suppressor protein